jgi:hypothetical protein
LGFPGWGVFCCCEVCGCFFSAFFCMAGSTIGLYFMAWR